MSFRDPDKTTTPSALRPGDILLTSPRKRDGWVDRVYGELSRRVQGTRYGHAALYVGDGRVIDARMVHGVKERALSSVLRNNDVVAVTPNVTERQRERAIDYARRTLGTRYSFATLMRAGLPGRGERSRLTARERLQRATSAGICSGLVANAYDTIHFSPAPHQLTRPGEILKARRVQLLGKLKREPRQ